MNVTPHQKEKAENIIREGIVRAKNAGLKTPDSVNIVWINKNANMFGYVRRGQNNIFMNVRYIETAHFWDTTFLHELAHLITFISFPFARQAHGPEFRYVCRTLGISDSTHAIREDDFPDRITRKQTMVTLACVSCGKHHQVSKRGHTRIYVTNRHRYYICDCGGRISGQILNMA